MTWRKQISYKKTPQQRGLKMWVNPWFRW